MNAHRVSLVVTLLTVIGLILTACGPAATPEPTKAPAPTEAAPTKAPAPVTEEGTPYKVGFCAAITGPGSSLGVPERNTAEMLAEQYADGVTGSDGVHHDVEFIIYDTESNPDTASSVASRLITEEEVDVLVCGTLSGNSMAIMPIATENEIPLISMASARAIIQDPETGAARKWIFKTPQENLHSGIWQARYLEALGATTICDLYENTGYGQDCLAQTTAAVEAKGIEIAYSDTFERSDTEFPQMTGVQASGCDAIVIGSIPPGASMATVAAREVLPGVPVIHGHGVCNQTFIDLAGDAAEDVVFPCGRLMIADLLPDTDPQKAILLKYAADYDAFTGGEPISTFGGHAWDAVMWALLGLESLDEGMSLADRRAGVRDYVEGNIQNWPGTGGVFNITPDDHLGLTYEDLTFVKVVDGTWAYYPPEDWPGIVDGTPYKVGFCAAITGPGSSLGIPERNTAEMLAEQFPSIIGPDRVRHELEFIIYDTESNPDTASSVASRLITEEEVDVLVCGTLSGNSMAIMPIATENEIPLISMASARAIIQDPETGAARKWIFKTPQENLHSGIWQARYLEALGITTICDLYENTGYGQDCLAQTTVAVEAKGIEVAYADTFERSDTEFPQMTGVQASGCDAIVIGSIPPGASMATVAAREVLPGVPVIHGHGVCNQAFIDLAGDAAEDVVFPCGRMMIADLLPDTDPQKAVLLKYIADYTAFTGGEPISTFGGHAWDAVMWAVQGLKSLDEGLSLADRRAAVRDYVEDNIQNWPGTGGVFNITPDDHLGLTYEDLTFVKVVGGTWAYYPPEEW